MHTDTYGHFSWLVSPHSTLIDGPLAGALCSRKVTEGQNAPGFLANLLQQPALSFRSLTGHMSRRTAHVLQVTQGWAPGWGTLSIAKLTYQLIKLIPVSQT